MKVNEIEYMHLDIGEGKATAAIKKMDSVGYESVMVGLAFCSPKDQFCKRTGRLISSGRLNKIPFWNLTIDPERKIKEQVHDAFVKAFEWKDPRLPEWALCATVVKR